MNRAPLTISIDRVVLRGVDPTQAKAVVEGLRTELANVFSSDALRAGLRNSGRTGLIRVGALPMHAGRAGARKFGAGIARGLGKAMRT
jgi:hypothetical protein